MSLCLWSVAARCSAKLHPLLRADMDRTLRFVRLECELGGSSKFHEQFVVATADSRILHKATWGKIGTAGTTFKDWPRPQDHYDSAAEALAALEVLQDQKLRKGYSLVSTDAAAAAAARDALIDEKAAAKKAPKKRAAPAVEDDGEEEEEEPKPKKKKAKATKAAPKKPAAKAAPEGKAATAARKSSGKKKAAK